MKQIVKFRTIMKYEGRSRNMQC